MGKESWYERLRRRQSEKKIAKLRQQFDFLIEEYRSGQEYSINEFKKFQESLNDSLSQLIEQNTSNSMDFIEKKIDENTIKWLDNLRQSEKAYALVQAEIRSLIVEISVKIDRLIECDTKSHKKVEHMIDDGLLSLINKRDKSTEKIENQIFENATIIQEAINTISENFTLTRQEYIRLLQEINSQLASMQKDMTDASISNENMLGEKCKYISLSIDEVKTLMKIVAVNNLLDEINSDVLGKQN